MMPNTSVITVEKGLVVWRLSAEEAIELSYLLDRQPPARGWKQDGRRLFEACDQIEATRV